MGADARAVENLVLRSMKIDKTKTNPNTRTSSRILSSAVDKSGNANSVPSSIKAGSTPV